MTKFVGKTVKFVEGKKPTVNTLQVSEGAADAQLFDSELRGFGMRRFAPNKRFPKGKVSYFVKFAIKGTQQQRRVTLGEVVDGNLKAMRLRAEEIISKGKLGTDVGAEAEAKAAAAANIVTLGAIIPDYLKAREGDLRDRSYSEVKRYLEQSWKPLHPMPV